MCADILSPGGELTEAAFYSAATNQETNNKLVLFAPQT